MSAKWGSTEADQRGLNHVSFLQNEANIRWGCRIRRQSPSYSSVRRACRMVAGDNNLGPPKRASPTDAGKISVAADLEELVHDNREGWCASSEKASRRQRCHKALLTRQLPKLRPALSGPFRMRSGPLHVSISRLCGAPARTPRMKIICISISKRATTDFEFVNWAPRSKNDLKSTHKIFAERSANCSFSQCG
jgi:hypothetical protein